MYLFRLFISALLFSFSSLTLAAVIIPKPPVLDATAYILMDADSGEVLVEHNSGERLPPASMTKMMTSYIAVHEIVEGNVTEDTMVPISVTAWKKGGSKMWVREGTEVKMIDLLRGIIVQSGNDASIAVAEYFAGSESAFAGWMNQYAQEFGMFDTNFENATGWPAEGHLTTARDLALLAKHIIKDHPTYYGLYAEKYFEYNDIRQPNRNKLLWRDPSVDGLKTGHTEEAGYCLAASAKRDNTRLIAVVMGTRSEEARARETQKLLGYGFRYFETHKLYSKGDVLATEKVWLAKQDTVDLVVADDIYMTLPRGSRDELVAEVVSPDYPEAPLSAGQGVGSLTLKMGEDVLGKHDLVAATEIEESGFFGRLFGSIKLFFVRLFA
ncbi:MAG: serine-type D-Ala-D-Ala carboxypeptidase [Oceanospirillaceae bacterium]|jgi:D-alanyl-D-alanine carboxypeptidase (penicillin-binding protein 5/6)|uniref:D-alanyl-D-alanine carboxypeptidase family protein n=1 Tax=Thalassolituus sp. TaxID=2030822 RepID=UPI000B648061|nr:D-alanyl-D-alanine carboxypeptidase family protein [Thalassolituus sp.]MAE35327.1 serine-type D-Ala-D-Ala carboxypeptidase [Oceanospirillaceae bacterium]MDQ4424154.1 D-alanyl-D-alanine carboxypeptidase family protein [Thalassolituus sp.]MDQ4425188.1 D-alanyl-D-alanine carboxypeptidase family protein [Thalassolituus sp.]OUX67018.1 MAG: serine-type D-Ala-D-Ala carboxypeptidase [Oceanospirillaceae bacterium TMED276]|tara:strand:- start:11648 stop:12796 length:1149 start_codon:yes stop_codon:yes gene_type:complete